MAPVNALSGAQAFRGRNSSKGGFRHCWRTFKSSWWPTTPHSKPRRLRASAWSSPSSPSFHAFAAEGFLLLERGQRADGLGDSPDDISISVDAVIAADEQLGAERQVVADEALLPAQKPSGKDLSTLLWLPTARAIPSVKKKWRVGSVSFLTSSGGGGREEAHAPHTPWEGLAHF